MSPRISLTNPTFSNFSGKRGKSKSMPDTLPIPQQDESLLKSFPLISRRILWWSKLTPEQKSFATCDVRNSVLSSDPGPKWKRYPIANIDDSGIKTVSHLKEN